MKIDQYTHLALVLAFRLVAVVALLSLACMMVLGVQLFYYSQLLPLIESCQSCSEVVNGYSG